MMLRVRESRRRHGWSAVGCAAWLALVACSSSASDAERCASPPPDQAACSTDVDCATVAVGCYCGPQPVNGVSVSHQAQAQACEAAAAASCSLGCAISPQVLTQDGRTADASTVVNVRCDHSDGAPRLCTTYMR